MAVEVDVRDPADAARHMVKSGYGRIVSLASTAGIRGGIGRAAYGSAKG